MKYEGKLYGKIGNKYFDTGYTTEDWDKLSEKICHINEERMNVGHHPLVLCPAGCEEGAILLGEGVHPWGAVAENWMECPCCKGKGKVTQEESDKWEAQVSRRLLENPRNGGSMKQPTERNEIT